MNQNLYDELQWRGLLADCTDPAVSAAGGIVPPDDTDCQDNTRTLAAADLLHDRAVLLRKGMRC